MLVDFVPLDLTDSGLELFNLRILQLQAFQVEVQNVGDLREH